MNRQEQLHLQTATLTLTPRGPLHCGSGTKYTKKEYLFDPRSGRVSILDQEKFFRLLLNKRLADRYEGFVLGPDTNLYAFLRGCGCTPDELRAVTRYVLDAGDALDGNHSLKEIQAFQRDGQGRAFLPGSTLKGALRTAWLAARMLEEDPRSHTLPAAELERRGDAQRIEGGYTNKLRCKLRDGRIAADPVNSIFRGLLVSDSEPLPDSAMILSGKQDVDRGGQYHSINLCRESVRPGTPIRFQLSLDISLLGQQLTFEGLLASIQAFDDYYLDTYLPPFKNLPRGGYDRPFLVLGGGAGFFSKTVIYPYLGKEKALGLVAGLLQANPQSRRHGHERDISGGISPHTLKYTRANGQLLPVGVCGVRLE